MKKVIIVSSLLVASLNAYSQASIFGKPSIYGRGCNSRNTTIATTSGTIDISFGNYNLTIGGSTGILNQGSDCTIDIPMTVPLGYSAVVDRIEYHGFAIVPFNGKLTFEADYYYDLIKASSTKKTISGPYNDSFTVSGGVTGESKVSTKCGTNPNLRIRSQVNLSTNRNQEDALMSLDRMSARGIMKFHYRLAPCGTN